MSTTLFASGARNVSNSTSGIHYKRKLLRRGPDPKPRSVIPVEKEIVVESHASVWMGRVRVRSQKVAMRVQEGSRGILGRRKEREDHGGTCAVVRRREESRR